MVTQTDVQTIRDPQLLAYLDLGRRMQLSPHTLKQYRQTSRRFQDFLDDTGRTVATVEPWQVDEFFLTMTDLELSTRGAHLKRLRSIFRYAQKRGVLQIDPTHDVRIPRAPDVEPVIIDNADLRRYKNAAGTDAQWAQFHLLAFAGVRRCEAIQLQWDDLSFPEQTLTIRNGKGGKLRHIPIHPQLAEALLDLRRPHEGPVIRPKRRAPNIGIGTWDSLLRETTGGGHTAHDFRRTMASSLAMNDVPDPLIDEILGWAPRAVGRRYYIKVAGPQLQRAVLRLYADDPI